MSVWECGVGCFQLQQEEAQKIRDRRANEAALAALTAIGSGTKRKRPSPSEGVSLFLYLFIPLAMFKRSLTLSRM